MKIAHLSSVHPRYDTRIFIKQCSSLAKAGFSVSFIVADGKGNDEKNGVKILDVGDKKGGRIRRMTQTVWGVYSKAVEIDAQVYHFHDPELIPVGMMLRMRGKKVIYDVHEDLPRQILSKDWIPIWLRYPVSWFAATIEWIGSRIFFSAIVPATPKIACRFPKSKTVLVQNFPILDELCNTKAFIPWFQRKNQIVYLGGISRIRGIIENIKAFESVKNKDCCFVLAGSFEDNKLERECRSLDGWSSVKFKGYLSRKEIQKIFNETRIGLVLFHPLPNHVDAQPNKMFEYMSASFPIIASDFPLWRKIVEGANCGILVNPLKPEEIAKAIDWLLDHPEDAEEMGKNGRKAVEDKYNWSYEENQLLKLYKNI